MNLLALRILVCGVVLSFPAIVAAQHLIDPEFVPTVARPAYPKSAPRVLFDEAHHNFHTSTSRFKPFADLMMNDGYRIVVNRQPFTKKSLDSFKVVIIANPLGDDIDEDAADKPAFTEDESIALRDWVRGGGGLLLLVDANPFAKAAANLAKQFGVELTGNVTQDKQSSSLVEYSRENQLLLNHPITQGRDADEKINRVVVFTGQSLKGPEESISLLKTADSATDLVATDSSGDPKKISAKDLAQGVALKFGDGRVVVLGDADMLSSLLSDPPEKEPIGMNYPGIDNKQLALNIMHWLSGLLK